MTCTLRTPIICFEVVEDTCRHKAILDYLHSAGYTKAYDQLKDELPNLVCLNMPPIAVLVLD